MISIIFNLILLNGKILFNIRLILIIFDNLIFYDFLILNINKIFFTLIFYGFIFINLTYVSLRLNLVFFILYLLNMTSDCGSMTFNSFDILGY